MGSILSFVPRKAANRPAGPPAEMASVIIFPGVRYERRAAVETAATGTAMDAQGGSDPAKPSPRH
ncbi:hypothetical protein C7441_103194 [Pseudaminobacter salicylatoxidans]|uniref:Uncharacterized protein n=1 Tax=Pseudaminobacter salicylatoxidans TaxID=93369 RepID=A0A316C757_PSESE|nr:hypothetical protein C7441_103194 [Pseudaminobacter salicylatoxidans]